MSDFVVSQDPEEVHCSLKEPVVVGLKVFYVKQNITF